MIESVTALRIMDHPAEVRVGRPTHKTGWAMGATLESLFAKRAGRIDDDEVEIRDRAGLVQGPRRGYVLRRGAPGSGYIAWHGHTNHRLDAMLRLDSKQENKAGKPAIGNRSGLVFGLLCGMLSAAGSAAAVDGVSLTGGTGDAAKLARVGMQWDWHKRWFAGEQWHLNGYWDLTLSRAFADQADQSHDITHFGITPVFRFEQGDRRGLYVDFGVGAHLISRTSINSDNRYGTAFQFGNQAGVGYRFGGRGEHDVQAQIQHLSNGGIKEPNQGINFYMLRYQYHF